jgi:hypothetical protein
MRALLPSYDLALIHFGAHAHSPSHQADGLVQLVDLFQALAPSRISVALLGHLPSHFNVSDGGGEYVALQQPPPDGDYGCVPHMLHAGASFAANWRATTLTSVARNRSLPVLDLWALAAGSWRDHPRWSTSHPGVDCRHWCNPGPTGTQMIRALTEALRVDASLFIGKPRPGIMPMAGLGPLTPQSRSR